MSITALHAANQATANPLEGYAWKKRIIVMYAPASKIDSLAKQNVVFQAQTGVLEKRDMMVISISEGTVDVTLGPELPLNRQALIDHIGFRPDRFGIVLIGKDTGIKLRSDTPVPLRDLLDLVDSMPMRQREMKR